MKKYFSLVILFYFFSIPYSPGQKNGCIKFESYNNYLGVYKQDYGNIQTNFIFTNECELVLHFELLTASSGCNIISYPKGPIQPGNKGIITVAYNSRSRIGKFTETVKISTNIPDAKDIVLSLSGEIIPRDKTTLDFYPYGSGHLKYKTQYIFFDKILDSETRVGRMPVYNNWDKPISINNIDTLPFVKCELQPAILEPDQEGNIIVYYNAYARKDYGIVVDTLLIHTNDDEEAVKKLVIKSDIYEDFSKLRDSKREIAPKISFTNTSWDFGLIKQGEVLKHDFEIKNKGIRELIVRKMDPSCPCISVKPLTMTIRQQKVALITVTITTRGYQGKHNEYITVISNDPDNPRMKLYIQGEIQ